jgi:hypothetical protein
MGGQEGRPGMPFACNHFNQLFLYSDGRAQIFQPTGIKRKYITVFNTPGSRPLSAGKNDHSTVQIFLLCVRAVFGRPGGGLFNPGRTHHL